MAATPEVRVRLVEKQRDWIDKHGGGVVEGRDDGGGEPVGVVERLALRQIDEDAGHPVAVARDVDAGDDVGAVLTPGQRRRLFVRGLGR